MSFFFSYNVLLKFLVVSQVSFYEYFLKSYFRFNVYIILFCVNLNSYWFSEVVVLNFILFLDKYFSVVFGIELIGSIMYIEL